MLHFLNRLKGEKRSLKTKELMNFCRQFSTMISSGLSIIGSLELLQSETEHRNLKKKLNGVIQKVERGNSLNSSFNIHGDFFPPLLVNIIGAGEAVGKLPVVLDKLSLHFERQYEMEQRLYTATLYPKFVLASVFLVIIFLVCIVLPKFVDFFTVMGVETPYITLFLLSLGNIFISFWHLIIVIFLVLFLSGKTFLRSKGGVFCKDWISINCPLLGAIYYKVLVARFCRTLSILLNSGIGMLPALELVKKVVNNKIAQDSIERLSSSIYRGETFSAAAANNTLFPPLVVRMIQVGEETGNLDSLLLKSADFLEAEAAHTIGRLNYILEPFLIIFLSFLVGVVILSFLIPMMEVFTTI